MGYTVFAKIVRTILISICSYIKSNNFGVKARKMAGGDAEAF
jgi:hypothetical protein